MSSETPESDNRSGLMKSVDTGPRNSLSENQIGEKFKEKIAIEIQTISYYMKLGL
jgi:hypothetical protein